MFVYTNDPKAGLLLITRCLLTAWQNIFNRLWPAYSGTDFPVCMLVCTHMHCGLHCKLWVEFFKFPLVFYKTRVAVSFPEAHGRVRADIFGRSPVFSLDVKGGERRRLCSALQWMIFQPLWCILFGKRVLENISCYVYNLLCIFEVVFTQGSFTITMSALTPHSPKANIKQLPCCFT